MTSENILNDCILDYGGANQITIYTRKIGIVRQKILQVVSAPSTGTIKPVKVLDLLRTQTRLTVNGYIDSASESKLDNIFEYGGPKVLSYKGVTDNVNIEKFELTEDENRQDERDLTITFIIGDKLNA